MERRAFTLVELLVVVAIVALLLAMLLPALAKARTVARAVVCQSNHRQIALALIFYAGENNQSLPRGHDFQQPGGHNSSYRNVLPPMLNESDKVWRCANATRPDSGNHYSSNPGVMTEIDSSRYNNGADNLRLDRIGRDAEVVMMIDGSQWRTTESATDAQAVARGLDSGGAVYGTSYNPSSSSLYDPIRRGQNLDAVAGGAVKYHPRWREAGVSGLEGRLTTNVSFADGHAESRTYPDLINAELRPDTASVRMRN